MPRPSCLLVSVLALFLRLMVWVVDELQNEAAPHYLVTYFVPVLYSAGCRLRAEEAGAHLEMALWGWVLQPMSITKALGSY